MRVAVIASSMQVVAIGILPANISHWKALQGTIMDKAREVERLYEDATRTPSASSSQGTLLATMAKGQHRKRWWQDRVRGAPHVSLKYW